MISPTVGRIVLYREQSMRRQDQSFPAIVTKVWNDRLIEVAAVDPGQQTLLFRRVPLLQDGDVPPTSGAWAEWMPFQKDYALRMNIAEAAGLAAQKGYVRIEDPNGAA